MTGLIPSSGGLSRIVGSPRALHILDAALAAWVVLWVGLGVAIGINLGDLSNLSHTAIVDGRAVRTVGGSLGVLSQVPLLGGSLAGVGHQVQLAGASAISGGTSSESSIQALSVLLAIAVALLPSIPVFGFYLPLRLDLRREARALSRAVSLHGDDPAFRAFLARRAVDSLGYHRLGALASAPWSDSGTEADSAALAAAELRRLGVDPAVLRRSDPSPASVGARSPT